jgi:ABC-type transport system involved in multi-copper enzyme maturation permease subunit
MTGFVNVLHAEWTKFRTIPGLVAGLLLLPVLTIGFTAFTSSGANCAATAASPNGKPATSACSSTTGPGGELVMDQFYFVHQGLTDGGSITARVTSLTGTDLPAWAKAGIMIKASTTPGSAYAAMLVTSAHGVRFQWNYTQDTAGLPGNVSTASPRWLRLVRDGDTVTGYDSPDGTHWTKVGTATLTGLPATAQAGLFAASPFTGGPAPTGSGATGAFGQVSLTGAIAGRWTGTSIGSGPAGPAGFNFGMFQRTGSGFTVNGNGDIAPDLGYANGGLATPISQALQSIFIGAIIAIIIGTVFITAEYRRGLIRVTLAATPARGRVLAAKAIVLAAVTFVAALIACAIALPLGSHLLRAQGVAMNPISAPTELRIVIGTAAVLAATAVIAVALGTVFRRGAATVATAIVLVVVPWFLAIAGPTLPGAVADWLARIFPAAAFAVQQTFREYPQVTAAYTPGNGFFPLPPLAGFAVLCAWTVGALWLAMHLLGRRDV